MRQTKRKVTVMPCTLCRDLGWTLDYAGGGQLVPIGLELLPCPIPDCVKSGQRIATMSVADAGLPQVVKHPMTDAVMSLSSGDLLDIAFAPDAHQRAS